MDLKLLLIGKQMSSSVISSKTINGSKDHLVKGILFSFITLLSFSVMAISVTHVKSVYDFKFIVFSRGIIGTSICLISMLLNKIPMRSNKYVFSRAIFGLIGISIYFRNLQNISPSEATFLNNLSPIIVFLLFHYYYKENLRRLTLWGILLLIFSSLVFLSSKTSLNYVDTNYFIGVAGAIFGGLAFVSLKKGMSNSNSLSMLLIQNIFLSVSLFPFLNFDFFNSIALNSETFTVLLISLLSFLGHFSMTKAYTYLSASVSSALIGTLPIIVYIIELIFFNAELVVLNLSVFLMMLVGITLISLGKNS